jgi:hypothetical protein
MARSDVRFSGPIFNKQKTRTIMDQATIDTIKDLAKAGREEVRSQLTPGHGWLTGELSRGLRTSVTKRGSGRVYPVRRTRGRANWIESGRSYRPTRFRGYGVFEEGQERLSRQAEPIAQGRVKIATRKLNGL